MKLTHSKGFAGVAVFATVAVTTLAGCSSAASDAPAPPASVALPSPVPSASQTTVAPSPVLSAAPGVVDVSIHPGEAFFVIAPPPDVIAARGLARTVAMHEAEPAGVVAEWVVEDQLRTIELAKAAAARDPQNVMGVLWVAEKPGHARFDVQWAYEGGTADPQWSRSYVVTVTK